MVIAKPHDLLRLIDPAAVLTAAEPGWVGRALAATPWVVVRRAEAPDGRLAVGVRGAHRHQRHAMLITVEAADDLVRPEQLRASPHRSGHETPALAALRACVPLLDGGDLSWGPVGSAGFELATGRPATSPTSDLDIVVRVDDLPGRAWAVDLIDRLSSLPARVDCQLESLAGAVALAELAGASDTILVRTLTGPRLVARASAITLADPSAGTEQAS